MTVDTQFALLSMTMPITSFVAMMPVYEGKLSLDDPVAKYVLSFAERTVGVEGVRSIDVLGRIIEIVSGETLYHFLKRTKPRAFPFAISV